MRQKVIIHPFLLSAFPILSLYSHNIGQVPFSRTVLPLTIALGLTCILMILMPLVLKDVHKAGLIISLFWIGFFSYGHIHHMMHKWRIGGIVIGRHTYLFLPWSLILGYGIYRLVRWRTPLRKLTSALNVAASFLFAIVLISIGIYQFRNYDDHQHLPDADLPISKAFGAAVPRTTHDIYYIILDAYSNSEVLQKFWNYDNQEFLNYLMDRGFFIATKSRSNYAETKKSLASSLNMNYLQSLIKWKKPMNSTVLHRMVRDNVVMKLLRSYGYQFIFFGSEFEITRTNPNADLRYEFGQVYDEFFVTLIRSTMLDPFFGVAFMAQQKRRRLLYTLKQLGRISEISGPKFVFAHLIAPHEPFLFTARGTPVPPQGLLDATNYAGYVAFINSQIRLLVDEILSKSEIPPIIIIQGDHGSYWWPHPVEKPSIERMKIFNAYYFPTDCDSSVLYDSISPVNTFRAVFNGCFDARYEFLPDRCYLLSETDGEVEFADVTDEVTYER